jgi:hypothetical protein
MAEAQPQAGNLFEAPSISAPLYSEQFTESPEKEFEVAEETGPESEVAEPTEEVFEPEAAPDHWSDELKAEWEEAEKRRIGDYTRKTQNLAERRKRFESSEDELTRKAQQFDLMMSNPDLVRKQLGIPDPAQAAAAAAPAAEEERVNAREVLQDTAYDAIDQMVRDRISSFEAEKLGAMDQYKGYIDNMARQNIQRDWNELVTKYPTAKKYETQVAQFVQQHGVTDLKQAFFAVAGDAAVEDGSKALLKQEAVSDRRRAQLPTQQAMAHGKTTPRDKPAKLVDAMLQVAKEQGVRFNNW